MPQKLVQTQTQQQTQTQTLTPQQLLVVHLLEMPVGDLEQRVENELMDNEALEPADHPDAETEDRTDTPEGEEGMSSSEADDRLADYASDDDTPDYLLRQTRDSSEPREVPYGESISSFERLQAQIGEHDLTPHQRELVAYLIGSLDDDGLLRKNLDTIENELVIYHNVPTTRQELEEALSVLQTFDPPGIGARSLQECLHLQLVAPDYRSPLREADLKIIDRYYDDFIHKRWDKLQQRLGLTDEQMARAKNDLTHLNPRPAGSLGDAAAEGARAVRPDFIVENDGEGHLSVLQNNGDVPTLHVSDSFRRTLAELTQGRGMSRAQRDAYTYTKQKIDAAQNFINAIGQRRHTMQITMEAIVDLQRPFFEEGDESLLRPMILEDVAKRTGLHYSTISRVTNGKYVQTDFGIFPLKYFFNDKYVTDDGTEHSTLKIRSLLRRLIDEEDKSAPLPDEKLTALLREQGYPVARRTVAKYREQMGIPVARLRK